jgi:prevent-host-death family protein
MQIIDIDEASTYLSRFIDQVENGESIVIARAGKPAAQLVPFVLSKQQRRLGLGEALHKLSDDFFTGFDSRNAAEIQTMFKTGK